MAWRSVPRGHFHTSWADVPGVLCAGEELQDCILIAVQLSGGWEPRQEPGGTRNAEPCLPGNHSEVPVHQAMVL